MVYCSGSGGLVRRFDCAGILFPILQMGKAHEQLCCNAEQRGPYRESSLGYSCNGAGTTRDSAPILPPFGGVSEAEDETFAVANGPRSEHAVSQLSRVPRAQLHASRPIATAVVHMDSYGCADTARRGIALLFIESLATPPVVYINLIQSPLAIIKVAKVHSGPAFASRASVGRHWAASIPGGWRKTATVDRQSFVAVWSLSELPVNPAARVAITGAICSLTKDFPGRIRGRFNCDSSARRKEDFGLQAMNHAAPLCESVCHMAEKPEHPLILPYRNLGTTRTQRIDQTLSTRRVSPLPNCDDHGTIERHPYGQKIKDRQLFPVSSRNVLNPHNVDDSLLRVRTCAVHANKLEGQGQISAEYDARAGVGVASVLTGWCLISNNLARMKRRPSFSVQRPMRPCAHHTPQRRVESKEQNTVEVHVIFYRPARMMLWREDPTTTFQDAHSGAVPPRRSSFSINATRSPIPAVSHDLPQRLQSIVTPHRHLLIVVASEKMEKTKDKENGPTANNPAQTPPRNDLTGTGSVCLALAREYRVLFLLWIWRHPLGAATCRRVRTFPKDTKETVRSEAQTRRASQCREPSDGLIAMSRPSLSGVSRRRAFPKAMCELASVQRREGKKAPPLLNNVFEAVAIATKTERMTPLPAWRPGQAEDCDLRARPKADWVFLQPAALLEMGRLPRPIRSGWYGGCLTHIGAQEKHAVDGQVLSRITPQMGWRNVTDPEWKQPGMYRPSLNWYVSFYSCCCFLYLTKYPENLQGRNRDTGPSIFCGHWELGKEGTGLRDTGVAVLGRNGWELRREKNSQEPGRLPTMMRANIPNYRVWLGVQEAQEIPPANRGEFSRLEPWAAELWGPWNQPIQIRCELSTQYTVRKRSDTKKTTRKHYQRATASNETRGRAWQPKPDSTQNKGTRPSATGGSVCRWDSREKNQKYPSSEGASSTHSRDEQNKPDKTTLSRHCCCSFLFAATESKGVREPLESACLCFSCPPTGPSLFDGIKKLIRKIYQIIALDENAASSSLLNRSDILQKRDTAFFLARRNTLAFATAHAKRMPIILRRQSYCACVGYRHYKIRVCAGAVTGRGRELNGRNDQRSAIPGAEQNQTMEDVEARSSSVPTLMTASQDCKWRQKRDDYLGSCENHKAWYGKSASKDDSMAALTSTTRGIVRRNEVSPRQTGSVNRAEETGTRSCSLVLDSSQQATSPPGLRPLTGVVFLPHNWSLCLRVYAAVILGNGRMKLSCRQLRLTQSMSPGPFEFLGNRSVNGLYADQPTTPFMDGDYYCGSLVATDETVSVSAGFGATPSLQAPAFPRLATSEDIPGEKHTWRWRLAHKKYLQIGPKMEERKQKRQKRRAAKGILAIGDEDGAHLSCGLMPYGWADISRLTIRPMIPVDFAAARSKGRTGSEYRAIFSGIIVPTNTPERVVKRHPRAGPLPLARGQSRRTRFFSKGGRLKLRSNIAWHGMAWHGADWIRLGGEVTNGRPSAGHDTFPFLSLCLGPIAEETRTQDNDYPTRRAEWEIWIRAGGFMASIQRYDMPPPSAPTLAIGSREKNGRRRDRENSTSGGREICCLVGIRFVVERDVCLGPRDPILEFFLTAKQSPSKDVGLGFSFSC
ncbi:hypothetical protein CCUS01_17431, partial [Colletotrichum cuscutae]